MKKKLKGEGDENSSFAVRKQTKSWKKQGGRGRARDEKQKEKRKMEMCFVCAPAPHDKCSHLCTNKNRDIVIGGVFSSRYSCDIRTIHNHVAVMLYLRQNVTVLGW